MIGSSAFEADAVRAVVAAADGALVGELAFAATAPGAPVPLPAAVVIDAAALAFSAACGANSVAPVDFSFRFSDAVDSFGDCILPAAAGEAATTRGDFGGWSTVIRPPLSAGLPFCLGESTIVGSTLTFGGSAFDGWTLAFDGRLLGFEMSTA